MIAARSAQISRSSPGISILWEPSAAAAGQALTASVPAPHASFTSLCPP